MTPLSPPGYARRAPSRFDIAYRQWERQVYSLITQHEKVVRRLLDMVPGLTTWGIILVPLLFSAQAPIIPVLLAVFFQVYMLYRTLRMVFHASVGAMRVRVHAHINWRQRYEAEREQGKLLLPWEGIHHLVIIPNYNEPMSKLRANLEALACQQEVASRIWVVLAMEAREPGAAEKARELQREFRNRLGAIYYTLHPEPPAGIIATKAANETWAALWARRHFVDRLGYNPRRITITTCDVDSVFHPAYFSCLTYHFATDPERHYRLWQPPVFYHNNIWQVPTFIRFTAVFMNVWQLAGLADNDYHTWPCSSYSASLSLLDTVGYWDPEVIGDDQHIILRCFFKRHGRVSMAPTYLPVLADAPLSTSLWRTAVNRYEQAKRHAWTASDIPYVIRMYFKHSEIPVRLKFPVVWSLTRDQIMWSTSAFVITLGFAIPSLLSPGFFGTHLGLALNRIYAVIGVLATILSLFPLIVDLLLRPPRPPEHKWWQVLWSAAQWCLLPVTVFLFVVAPAVDAQTRLLLGQKLGFRVTEKC